MKLRNKKTGKVGWLELYYDDDDNKMIAVLDEKSNYHPYETLAELSKYWEDYKPAEPLIKDEKIRKAVRAWYDAIDYDIGNLLCIKTSGNTRLEISDGSPNLIYISLFVDKGTLCNIKDRTYYTIAELCGEEEE